MSLLFRYKKPYFYKRFLFIVGWCVLYSFNSFSQQVSIKNLVFEGAGIRGIAYAGVLEELEKSNMLTHIEKVGGTSAGAIIALAVSLGYKSNEVKDIIYQTNFNQFNDGKFSIFGGLHRMKKYYGWYQGRTFDKWVSRLIAAKTGNTDLTFQMLHDQGYKDLYVTATCLNQQKVIVFSYQNYPLMKVKDAVRISMSIPLYFKAVLIDHQGKVLSKADDATKVDLVMDGGLLANFPIYIFDTIDTNTQGDAVRKINFQTIGFRIDSDKQIELNRSSKQLEPIEINSFGNYLQAAYVLILENLNRQPLMADDWKRTVSVSSANISPVLKKLSATQKNVLIENGKKATRAYIQQLH